MHARTFLAGLATTAVALSALTLTAGSASAATAPDDTAGPAPVLTDLIGVGSDTTQGVVKALSDAYNASITAGSPRVYSFAAINPSVTGTDTIVLPSSTINRPNGSGAGKGLLQGGTGNAGNTDIDFARSSAAIQPTEAQNGLRAFAFALDSLGTVVSNSTPSNAPTQITVADLVKIYKGQITKWNQIPGNEAGSAATIKPLIPQSGSGTRSFFLAQLQAANENVAIDPSATATVFQENDDTLIKNDPNAIAPFSIGLAGLRNGTIRVETGFVAQRALYNVVRGTDVSAPLVQAVFATTGYFCSTAARSLIEASGFKQLATPANGGACGTPLDAATSNFILNQQVATTTTLSATAPNPNAFTLTATVTTPSGSAAPSGTVSFFNGDTLLQAGVPLTAGQATYTKSNLEPGSYNVTAKFVPDTGFDPSQASTSVLVKTAATITSTLPATVAAGTAAAGTVTVALANTTQQASGTVTLTEGATTLTTAPLSGTGQASVTLPVLAPGAHTITISYSGNDIAAGTTKDVTITVGKFASAITSALPASVKAGTAPKGAVAVTLTGTAQKATGNVIYKEGAKTLKTVALTSAGNAAVTLPVLAPGAHTITITYPGSAAANASSKTVKITVTKLASSLKESFPATVAPNKLAKGTVTATLVGSTAKPTGSLKVYNNGKVVKTVGLVGGKATFSLPKLTVGKHTIKVVYAGSATATGKTLVFTVTQKKPKN